jgi:hypothetical protein
MGLFDGRRKFMGEKPYAGVAEKPRNSGVRVGRVVTVNKDGDFAGTVDVAYVDGVGGRQKVIVTQKSPKSFDMPDINDIVLLGYTIDGLCYILGYLPLGIANKFAVNADTGGTELPPLEAGDQFIKGSKSQGLRIANNGDIILDNGRGGFMTMRHNESTTAIDDVNYSLTTEAGVLYFGIVEREIEDSAGIPHTIMIDTNGLEYVSSAQKVATELVLKVVLASDNDVTTSPPIDSPAIELRMGNVVSNSGTLDAEKRIYLKINDSTGSVLSEFIFKADGSIVLKPATGKTVSVGDTENVDSTVLFSPLKSLLSDFIQAVGNHTHPSDGVTPSNGVTINTLKDKIDRMKTTEVKVS